MAASSGGSSGGRFNVFGRSRRAPTGQPGEWYYCLKHHKVEEGPECPAKNRLGPYESREEAARAIEIARDRDESWRRDPRWNDRGRDDES
ncbi:hypothetical protein [Streptomyces sp. B6B3]|jgi:hypothetical protein|uniref:hypothetical protein n=1 Tax=Streptomyces sp. B6B3 TaxID=3153570 RepID=UPI00325CFD50